MTIRDGLDGYMGTRDLELREADPDTNTGPNDEMSIDQEDGGLPTQGLLRFENLFSDTGGPIPEGSTINSAELSVFVTSEAGSATISFFRMLRDWDEDTDTWNSLFAPLMNDDIDAVMDPDGTLTPANFQDAFATIDVTPGVEAWLGGADNFGWLITNSTTNGWDIVASENSIEANRPSLIVDFTPPAMPPDLNEDGVVDNADFQILRGNMYAHLDGMVVSFTDGDIDFDGDIDLLDFRRFKADFPGAVGAAAGVPEPATLGLLIVAVGGILLARRRRRSAA